MLANMEAACGSLPRRCSAGLAPFTRRSELESNQLLHDRPQPHGLALSFCGREVPPAGRHRRALQRALKGHRRAQRMREPLPVPSSLRPLSAPLDALLNGLLAFCPALLETLAPSSPLWYKGGTAEKDSSRAWKPDSRGGYTARNAGGFLLPCSWAHCIQRASLFHCTFYGAVMREASCLPVP